MGVKSVDRPTDFTPSFSGGVFFLFRAMVGAGQQAAREEASAQAACRRPMAGGGWLRAQEGRG